MGDIRCIIKPVTTVGNGSLSPCGNREMLWIQPQSYSTQGAEELTIHQCHGLNVVSLQNSYIEVLIPNVLVLGGGACGDNRA